jgi:hypothetical protein
VNYGSFEGYDESGQPTTSFTGSEIALSAGYAYNIPLYYTNIRNQSNFVTVGRRP